MKVTIPGHCVESIHIHVDVNRNILYRIKQSVTKVAGGFGHFQIVRQSFHCHIGNGFANKAHGLHGKMHAFLYKHVLLKMCKFIWARASVARRRVLCEQTMPKGTRHMASQQCMLCICMHVAYWARRNQHSMLA